MIKWNATKNTNVPLISGRYIITIEDVRGDWNRRFTTTAYFNRIRDSWTWEFDDSYGTTTLRNKCESVWEDEDIVFAERIVAWAEMPKPYQG